MLSSLISPGWHRCRLLDGTVVLIIGSTCINPEGRFYRVLEGPYSDCLISVDSRSVTDSLPVVSKNVVGQYDSSLGIFSLPIGDFSVVI